MTITHRLEWTQAVDWAEVLTKSGLKWIVLNEETHPHIQTFFEKKEKTSLGRKKRVSITLWASGKMVIVGVTSLDEAKRFMERVREDLQKIGVAR